MAPHHIATARIAAQVAAVACGVGGRGLGDQAAPAREETMAVEAAVTVGRAAVAAAISAAEEAARNGIVRGGAERAIRVAAQPIIATARPAARVAALARLARGRGLADRAAARVVVAVTWRRRLRADFPPAVVNTAIGGPREGGTAQQRVAGPGRAAVRHAVHNQLVIAALGGEGGRAQELTNSQARRRDRARLAVAVVGGVVGRANAETVYSARPVAGEVGACACRSYELPVRRLREHVDQDEERV